MSKYKEIREIYSNSEINLLESEQRKNLISAAYKRLFLVKSRIHSRITETLEYREELDQILENYESSDFYDNYHLDQSFTRETSSLFKIDWDKSSKFKENVFDIFGTVEYDILLEYLSNPDVRSNLRYGNRNPNITTKRKHITDYLY